MSSTILFQLFFKHILDEIYRLVKKHIVHNFLSQGQSSKFKLRPKQEWHLSLHSWSTIAALCPHFLQMHLLH